MEQLNKTWVYLYGEAVNNLSESDKQFIKI